MNARPRRVAAAHKKQDSVAGFAEEVMHPAPSTPRKQKTSSDATSQLPLAPPKQMPFYKASPASPANSPRLTLMHNGKVFRSLPNDTKYGELMGEPDETVEDLLADKREQRRAQFEKEAGIELIRSPKKIRLDKVGRSSPSKLSHRPVPTGVGETMENPFLAKSGTLPLSLYRLVLLQKAVESSLLLHMANSGSSLASSPSEISETGQAQVKIENLITLVELEKLVSSSGQKLDERELARLVWVWEGCQNKNNLLDDSDEEISFDLVEAGGLGFIVTRTRTTSTNGKGILPTYGIGIKITVKSNPQLPTFELVDGSEKKNLSPTTSLKKYDGMSITALWSTGKQQRMQDFENRLTRWAKKHGWNSNIKDAIQLPAVPEAKLPSVTPTSPFVTTSGASVIPGINFSSPRKRPRGSDSFLDPPPSPSKGMPITPTKSRTSTFPLNDEMRVTAPNFMSASPLTHHQTSLLEDASQSPQNPTTGKQRLQGLAARIQAKSTEKNAYQESLESLSNGLLSPNKNLEKLTLPGDKTAKKINARIVEKSRLETAMLFSRLPNVADTIWMLFSVGNKNSIKLNEVTSSIVTSNIMLSNGEALKCVELISKNCPEFILIKTIGTTKWVCKQGSVVISEVKQAIREISSKLKQV